MSKEGHNVFGVVYRPPGGSTADFLTFIDRLLSHASVMDYMLTVGGDFNIDVLKNSATSTEFLSVLECNSFKNVITMPTRITESTVSLLDMFVTNSTAEETISGVISSDINDRLPIFIFLKMHTNLAYVKLEKFIYRSITLNTLEHFRCRIMQTHWDDIMADEDANNAYNNFIATFKELYFESFPLKAHHRSSKLWKPWITNYLKRQINHKNKLYQQFVKTRNADLWVEYKALRNRLNKKKKG